MSELKVYHHELRHNEYEEFYLKYEADEVIAEKDAKILALEAEVFKQKHHAKLFFDERNYAETQLRRQKYKRCLAMAKWCDAKADWYCGIGRSFSDRVEFYIKWHKRWLELAEKFKHNNSTAQ